MNNEKPSPEVFIEEEGRTWKWGHSGYLKTWNGLKETLSQETIKAIALPIGVVIAVTTFFFSDERELKDVRGQELNVPTVSGDVTILNAPILSGREIPKSEKRTKVSSGVVGRIQVLNLRSILEIPVGSEAKARLESGASNGIVKARLTSALLVESDAIFPEGTVIFGRGKSTVERLYVEFRKAILPTGESVAIRGQAFDVADKILGLKGAFIGNKSRKMGHAIGFGVLGGMAEGLQESSGTSIWGTQPKKTMRDAALSGASKAALDQSQAAIGDMKNAPHIIEVKTGTEFYLIIDEPKKKENGIDGE